MIWGVAEWGGSLSFEDDKIITSCKDDSAASKVSAALSTDPLKGVQHFQFNKIVLCFSTIAVVLLWDEYLEFQLIS